jgi:pimeloyl-ACP methyl ester carboxylesterase
MTAAALDEHVEMRTVAGGPLEVYTAGAGPTLLLLHGSHGWWGWEPIHERLAERFTVLAPSHPGFGRSPRAAGLDSIDDLAYYYLDLIAEWALPPATILGFGMGGWLALEMAVRCPPVVGRLVLVDSVGIKVSDRETRDIADPYILPPARHQALLWHDAVGHHAPLPERGMDRPVLEAMLHNLESAMYYGWKPYMHNPKLRQRLHRVAAPTLVVWGEQDRIVSSAYGRAFADLIPGARFTAIPDCGHYPHREQTERFLATVLDFLNS